MLLEQLSDLGRRQLCPVLAYFRERMGMARPDGTNYAEHVRWCHQDGRRFVAGLAPEIGLRIATERSFLALAFYRRGRRVTGCMVTALLDYIEMWFGIGARIAEYAAVPAVDDEDQGSVGNQHLIDPFSGRRLFGSRLVAAASGRRSRWTKRNRCV